MSRYGFKKAAPEPVVLDSVWQYGPSYHRGGRFIVLERLRPDFWRCKEILASAAERNYTTDDIIHNAMLTEIQPGQFWEDDCKRVCEITRPVFGYHDAWNYKRDDLGDLPGTAFDPQILQRWTRIDAVAVNGARCPLCGGRGFAGFTSFECSTPKCRNFRRR